MKPAAGPAFSRLVFYSRPVYQKAWSTSPFMILEHVCHSALRKPFLQGLVSMLKWRKHTKSLCFWDELIPNLFIIYYQFRFFLFSLLVIYFSIFFLKNASLFSHESKMIGRNLCRRKTVREETSDSLCVRSGISKVKKSGWERIKPELGQSVTSHSLDKEQRVTGC